MVLLLLELSVQVSLFYKFSTDSDISSPITLVGEERHFVITQSARRDDWSARRDSWSAKRDGSNLLYIGRRGETVGVQRQSARVDGRRQEAVGDPIHIRLR